MLFAFSRLEGAGPNLGREEYQNGEDLQSARQHIEAENKLGKDGKFAETARRTNRTQAGTDVVERGGNTGKIGRKVEIVQRDDQH